MINKKEDKIKSPKESYEKYTGKKFALGIFLLIALFLVVLYSINTGSMQLTPLEIIQTVMGKSEESSRVVLFRIRLPRIIGAIVAGCGLSLAGCVMQNNLRNPLASPSTLGISNAAAFGANLAIIVFGAGSVGNTTLSPLALYNPYIVASCAFAFSMISMTVILMLAKLKAFSSESIVLSGVALGSLFTASTTLLQYFAEDVKIAVAVFWSFGDLGRASWREVLILSIVVALAFTYFLLKRWDYNALDAGEESAKALGVDVERVRMGSMFMASLITAVCVSFLGVIGFIGLISPQIIRKIIGNDHRFLIPLSGILGSLILLISDTIARTLISPIILPVGAITSFFGAPLFLYLLLRGNQKR